MKIAYYYHVMRFRRKGKLAPKFIELYEILECMGKSAYRLVLLASMDRMDSVFHLSLLHKYLRDPTHVLRVENVKLRNDLAYEERPIQVLDRQVKQLKKYIPLVKIL